MCLAQGHNTVTPVKLEPVAPRSRVKHSITEPLFSLGRKSDKNSKKHIQISWGQCPTEPKLSGTFCFYVSNFAKSGLDRTL